MPKQEVFFEQQIGERRIEVLKSYDQAYAREAFKNMDEEALQQLWTALKPEEIYDPAGLPALGDPEGEGEAFLWDELLGDTSRNGNLCTLRLAEAVSGYSEGSGPTFSHPFI
jgi:hypothetical protein